MNNVEFINIITSKMEPLKTINCYHVQIVCSLEGSNSYKSLTAYFGDMQYTYMVCLKGDNYITNRVEYEYDTLLNDTVVFDEFKRDINLMGINLDDIIYSFDKIR